MTLILTFIKGEFDRELVRLGDVIVGEISPHKSGRVHATFSLRLPDCRWAFRPAVSFEAARESVQHEVERFLVRLGVFYPEQPIEVADHGQQARKRGMMLKLFEIIGFMLIRLWRRLSACRSGSTKSPNGRVQDDC